MISRHQGLLGNIGSELRYGRQVQAIGAKLTEQLNWFHPWDNPILKLDKKIENVDLNKNILELYDAFRTSVKWKPEDIATEFRKSKSAFLDVHENNDCLLYTSPSPRDRG